MLSPGYGLGTLTGKWKSDPGLSRQIGFSLGYGLAVDTAALAIGTLGLRLGPLVLAGVYPWTVYSLVGLGPALVLISALAGHEKPKAPTISKSDLAVLGCSAVVALVAWLYFAKYPVFPIYYNPDFVANVGQPAALVAGTMTSFRLLLYGAAYYQVAASFAVVGSSSLATAEVAMTLLAVLSPALVYAVASDLFSSRRPALIAVILYSLAGTTWAQMIYSDGLYPNFVGTLLGLVLVAAFFDVGRGAKSWRAWVAFAAAVVATYFSHFTVLAVMGSLLAVSVALGLMKSPRFKGSLAALAAMVVPGGVGLLVFHRLIGRVIATSYQGVGFQPLATYLSAVLAPVPSLAYLASDIRNDVGFLAMAFLFGVGAYRAGKTRDPGLLLLAIWFFAVLVVAPQDSAAWRFSLEAVLPMTLLAGYGLHSIMPQKRVTKQQRARAGDPYKFGIVVLALLFVTPIVAPGWASTLALNLSQGSGQEAQIQLQVQDAMTWLGQNTPKSAYLLSVTDPTFLYASVQIGRNCTYEYFGNETQAVSFARAEGMGYIVVTLHNVFYNPSVQASDTATNLPWYTYRSTANVTLAYSNPDVKVFRLG
ncbi:MAG: hypothetical protein JRM80_07400 [Nitrososphaerota archaeon]|nr:hypothetical protein [Nitrososphaerota archaeon]MDG6990735.1 hypothetical protein [Nitrososphaerota archaeon]